MGFEVFSRKSAGRLKEPTMTIQKRGNLSLNSAAAHLLADEPDQLQVELLFDKDRRIVGLRKARESPNPYVIRRQVNSESYLVAGRAFTEYYDIDTTTARRYKARLYDGDILGFCLDDDHAEVGRSDRRSREKVSQLRLSGES